jgi:hypothetical protein
VLRSQARPRAEPHADRAAPEQKQPPIEGRAARTTSWTGVPSERRRDAGGRSATSMSRRRRPGERQTRHGTAQDGTACDTRQDKTRQDKTRQAAASGLPSSTPSISWRVDTERCPTITKAGLDDATDAGRRGGCSSGRAELELRVQRSLDRALRMGETLKRASVEAFERGGLGEEGLGLRQRERRDRPVAVHTR